MQEMNIKFGGCCVKWLERYFLYPSLVGILINELILLNVPIRKDVMSMGDGYRIFLIVLFSICFFSSVARFCFLFGRGKFISGQNFLVLLYCLIALLSSVFVPSDWTPISEFLSFSVVNEWSFLVIVFGSFFLKFKTKGIDILEAIESQRLFAHRMPHLQKLKEMVFERSSLSSPYIIAVNGSWGSGKTFFLNHFKYSLDKDYVSNSSFVIYFNPMRFMDLNRGVKSLLQNVKKSIAVRVDSSLLGFDVYVEAVSRTDEKWTSVIINKLLHRDFNEDVELMVDSFNDLMLRNKLRGVVIVDEIDRLDAHELEVVLKVLRTTSVIRGLTIICGVDLNAVLVKDSERKNGFLQKYFDYTFNLPRDIGIEIKDELLAGFADLASRKLLSEEELVNLKNLVKSHFEIDETSFILDGFSSAHYKGIVIFKQVRSVVQFLDSFEKALPGVKRCYGNVADLFYTEMLKLLARDVWGAIPELLGYFNIEKSEKDGLYYVGLSEQIFEGDHLRDIFGMRGEDSIVIRRVLEDLFCSESRKKIGRVRDLHSLLIYFNGDHSFSMSIIEFVRYFDNENYFMENIDRSREKLIAMMLDYRVWHFAVVDIERRFYIINQVMPDESALEGMVNSVLRSTEFGKLETRVFEVLSYIEKVVYSGVDDLDIVVLKVFKYFLREYRVNTIMENIDSINLKILEMIKITVNLYSVPELLEDMLLYGYNSVFAKYDEFESIVLKLIQKNSVFYAFCLLPIPRSNAFLFNEEWHMRFREKLPANFYFSAYSNLVKQQPNRFEKLKAGYLHYLNHYSLNFSYSHEVDKEFWDDMDRLRVELIEVSRKRNA